MSWKKSSLPGNGSYDSLPGNEQTLMNYVHFLEDFGQINTSSEQRRIYDHVFDTPPGEQMLIDFGEVRLERNRAIYRSFCNLGGHSTVVNAHNGTFKPPQAETTCHSGEISNLKHSRGGEDLECFHFGRI